jgi:hypothetical protein
MRVFVILSANAAVCAALWAAFDSTPHLVMGLWMFAIAVAARHGERKDAAERCRLPRATALKGTP